MKIHIVQKGDTLWELSKQYGVNFEELKQANSHLASPDMIMPGMKIKIPSTTKAVKKETVKKEQPKKETKIPYKDTTPKPLPVHHEEEKKQEKVVQPQMPIISPKLPVIDQDFHFNFTQMQSQPKPEVKKEMKKEVKKEEVKKEVKHEEVPKETVHPTQPQLPIIPPVMPHQPIQQPVEQPIMPQQPVMPQQPILPPVQQPMYQPVPQMPCCFYVPCYPPMHHPMPHPMMPDMFMAPAQSHPPYPGQQASDDCGCGGGGLTEQMPATNFYPEQQEYTAHQPTLYTNPQVMGQTPFSEDSKFHYPTPPTYPNLYGHEREEEEDNK